MKVTLSVVGLRGESGDKADAFHDFLKEKLSKEVKISAGEPIEFEGEQLKTGQIRLLAKKYLGKEKLLNELRVVSIGETLAIKKRKQKRFSKAA